MILLTMLIVDLLNILFDQSDYGTLVILASLHKRKTLYANKYSLLRYYVNGCVNNVGTICVNGSIKMLKHVANDVNVNMIVKYDTYDFRVWWNSIVHNQLEITKYMVMTLGCDVNECGGYAIRIGAGFGCFEVVKYLTSMTKDAHRWISGEWISGALSFAASGNHLDIMKFLVGYSKRIGADVKCIIDFGLKWCANAGHSKVAKCVRGEDVQAHESQKLIFRENYGNLEMIEYLVSMGADVHSEDEYALRKSAKSGHWHMVKYFVSIGADIHADNENVLRFAAMGGNFEIVKYLISAGADINVNNNELFNIQLIKDNFSHLQYT